MTNARVQMSGRSGFLWIVVNAFGWASYLLLAGIVAQVVWQISQSGGVVFSPFRDESNRGLITLVVVGCCWGTIVGGLQWLILRRRIDLKAKDWVMATIAGLIVYILVQLLYTSVTFPLLGLSRSFFLLEIFLSLGATLIPPLGLGLLQWLILRRYLMRSGWWIVATALGFELALPITTWLSRSREAGYDVLSIGVTVLVQGLMYGLATWIALSFLSQRQSAAPIRLPEKGNGFNWWLALLGAIGFWIGFTFSCGISVTYLSILQNSLSAIFPTSRAGPDPVILKGVLVGGLGGAALGLGFKDKIRVLYFSLAGAIGFVIAFAAANSLNDNLVREIERFIPGSMGGLWLSSFSALLVTGLTAGVIVGGIGGLIIGLASPKGTLVSSLILGCTGAIWFAIAFAVHHAIADGRLCYSWDGGAGAVGGAIFGTSLALWYKLHDRLKSGGTRAAISGQDVL